MRVNKKEPGNLYHRSLLANTTRYLFLYHFFSLLLKNDRHMIEKEWINSNNLRLINNILKLNASLRKCFLWYWSFMQSKRKGVNVKSLLIVGDQCSWMLWVNLFHEFTSPRALNIVMNSLALLYDKTSYPRTLAPTNKNDSTVINSSSLKNNNNIAIHLS